MLRGLALEPCSELLKSLDDEFGAGLVVCSRHEIHKGIAGARTGVWLRCSSGGQLRSSSKILEPKCLDDDGDDDDDDDVFLNC